MAEFNIRTDAVDVEQIMRQIRARIREKRGVDYTEEQIQELASVKLEKFLDAKGVRSDLVEQFRHARGAPEPPPNYGFEDTTLFESHRGVVRLIRRMLHPILKLFFNPNPLSHVLHLQSRINDLNARRFHVRDELDALYYEVVHNLVLETTRLGIEVKNLKMRVESLSSRLDFDERRSRALEGVVQYRPSAGAAARRAAPGDAAAPSVDASPAGGESAAATGEEAAAPARRRRRRRGRRGRSTAPPPAGAGAAAGAAPPANGGPEAQAPADSARDQRAPDDRPIPSDQ